MNTLKPILLKLFLKRITKKNIVTQPKVVELDGKKCIGYTITTTLKGNKKKVDIPPFYHKIYDNNKLCALNKDADFEMYCIFDFHKNHLDFDYYVAVEKKSDVKAEKLAEINLPGGKYIQVEFMKRNHKSASFVILYLRGIWMKQNGYCEKDTPPFIVYDERFHSNYREFGCKGENYLGNPIAVLHIPIEN